MSLLCVVLRVGSESEVVVSPAYSSRVGPALSLGSGSDRVVVELPADERARGVFLSRLVDAASSLRAESGVPAVS